MPTKSWTGKHFSDTCAHLVVHFANSAFEIADEVTRNTFSFQQSVASSPFVETLVASSEGNAVSFGEMWWESIREKSLKMLRLFFFCNLKCRSVNKHQERMFSWKSGLVKTQPTCHLTTYRKSRDIAFPWSAFTIICIIKEMKNAPSALLSYMVRALWKYNELVLTNHARISPNIILGGPFLVSFLIKIVLNIISSIHLVFSLCTRVG